MFELAKVTDLVKNSGRQTRGHTELKKTQLGIFKS